jgi:hypothetical protein
MNIDKITYENLTIIFLPQRRLISREVKTLNISIGSLSTYYHKYVRKTVVTSLVNSTPVKKLISAKNEI